MKVSYTRIITKDIERLTNIISDTICDYVYDEIGTDDFTSEDYETVQPIIHACALVIGEKLVEEYSTTEH